MKNARKMFMLGIMVFAGCATTTVSSDYNRAVDFSKLKTYDWSNEQKPTGDMRFDDPDLRAIIKQSIETNLQAKGLQKAAVGQPDLLLKYYITVEQKKENAGDGYPPAFVSRGAWSGVAGPNNFAAQEMRTFHYDEGTFVLDMLDPKSGEILWRGSLNGMVDPGGTPEKRKARAPGAVAKVLAKFPPAKK
jgi:hypothetical protein